MSDEIITYIGKRFLQRTDVKAVQHPDGAWHPERTKFTKSDLRAHLSGKRTYGHYMLNEAGEAKLFAYDIDLDQTGTYTDDAGQEVEYSPRELWASGDRADPQRRRLGIEMRALAEGLAYVVEKVLNVAVAVSYSGSKGMHVYAFTGTESAATLREAAQLCLQTAAPFKLVKGKNFWKRDAAIYQDFTIEIYPKQDTVRKGQLGNLMRLPLGVDQRNGQRSFFLDVLAPPDKWRKDDPLEALSFGSIRAGEEKAVLWDAS